MTKNKLLSYKFKIVVPFGNGEYRTVYELTILKIRLFGLIKKRVVMDYNISMFEDIKDYKSHWNNLIKTGQTIELSN